MVLEVISTNWTSTYAIDAGDEVYLTQGTRVTSSTNAFTALHDGDLSLFIHGAVASLSTSIRLGSTASSIVSLNVLVGSTGTVENLSNVVRAIEIRRSGSQIVNNGEITSGDDALFFTVGATSGTVLNTGIIHSRLGSGIQAAGEPVSVSGIFRITNTGSIFANYAAVNIDDQALILINSGTLTASIGVSFDNNASNTNAMELNNTGTIFGTAGLSVDAANSGDSIVNSGRLIGNVALRGGDDTFDGRGGVVEGRVLGGTGDDTFIIDNSTIRLTENIGDGSDTVNSSVGWTLGDNFENLTLMGSKGIRGIGNGENNNIFGNDADNRLRGRAGDDEVNGAGGDDNIRGQKGNDTLDGGYGDDIINGNRGNDTLSGGAGDDLLKGGVGSDRYIFDFNNDGNDTIKDVGGSSDTLAVYGRVMSQLDFRRSGNDLVIESGGTVDRVVIDDFYIAGDAGRIEILATATTTKYMQTGLIGGATDDIIVGFSGTQIINGGGGDDILIGKGGKDRITGGSGADRFDYDALSDSGTTATTMDTIYDFVAGTDRIDLFDIDADSTTAGNQNFSFIGAGAYTGTAGELRYQFVGGNTRIGVDVDGDMVDDFNILLAGNIAFSAGDFVL